MVGGFAGATRTSQRSLLRAGGYWRESAECATAERCAPDVPRYQTGYWSTVVIIGCCAVRSVGTRGWAGIGTDPGAFQVGQGRDAVYVRRRRRQTRQHQEQNKRQQKD